MALQPIEDKALRYDHIIGTGGIGSGMVFSFPDAHTLGRNESRLARLEPFRDYCKQHIILHYISVLLGYGQLGFKTHPIGAVGNDDVGKKLILEMQEAGLDTKAISISKKNRTMFSVCYQYPDFSGGNITTNNSACEEVSPEHIKAFYKNYTKNGKNAIVLAAPEVPLSTRIELLKYGRKEKSLNVACILSSEISDFQKMKGFQLTDILSINRDEALKIAGKESTENFLDVIKECIKVLSTQNDSLIILMTDGANGSYCYQYGNLEFTPALPTKVASTAGAGDAFLSGVLTGLCCGLPLQKGFETATLAEKPLATAIELGALLASMSVTSANTIHFGVNAFNIKEYATQHSLTFGSVFSIIFNDWDTKTIKNEL